MTLKNISKSVFILGGVILIATDPVFAQENGGALGDVVVDSLLEFLRELIDPVAAKIGTYSATLVETILNTPHPNSVFSQPTNGPWPELYEYYWNTIIPLSFSLYGLALGLVILLESTSYAFSSYHRSKLKRRAFTGLVGILSWWWIAAFSLRFMDALTGILTPSLSDITLFETASFSGMAVLGLVLSLSVDLALFVLLALIYLARQLVLYLFVLLMPVLIVMWIPGVGPFALLSRFVKKFAGFYVPFLFMTVPVAVLFRLGELLGNSFELSAGGIGAWLTAIVIPFLAVLAPLVLIWQAGGIFFIGDRIARRTSVRRAQGRIARARSTTRSSARGGRNFLRGAQGKPAVRANGQTVLNSADSRAHATGDRLNAAGSRLQSRVRSDGGQPRDDGAPEETTDRTHDFEQLRDR